MRELAVAAAVLACVCSSSAGVKTYVGPSGGAFSNLNHWSPLGVPGAGDRIVIPGGMTCRITADATVDTVEIGTSDAGIGELVIDAGIILTLENDSDNIAGTPDNSVVDGKITLDNAATVPSILRFDLESHAVSGVGEIYANFVDCEIQVGSGVVLTNQLATIGIRGDLTIQGYFSFAPLTPVPGYLRNEGIVAAYTPQSQQNARLVLGDDLELQDIQGSLWLVDTCKGGMEFHRESPDLLGDFTNHAAAPGNFIIEQNVKTCGTYTRNAGGLDLATGRTFKYAAFGGGSGACTNPGSVTGTPSCLNPYTASADSSSCISCSQ